jgi:hypothetical protein
MRERKKQRRRDRVKETAKEWNGNKERIEEY